MFNSFGLGETLIIVINIIILIIPILLIWLFFKTLLKISRHSELIEQEVKVLREEIKLIAEKIPGNSPK